MKDPEEAAWAELEGAIEKFLEDTGEPGLLMDWVLVTHKIITAHPDGGDTVSTSITGAQNQPQYRCLGLLEYGAAAVRAQVIEDQED